MAGAIAREIGRGSLSTELVPITAQFAFKSLLRGDASNTNGGTAYPTADTQVEWGWNASAERWEHLILFQIPTTAIPRKANIASAIYSVRFTSANTDAVAWPFRLYGVRVPATSSATVLTYDGTNVWNGNSYGPRLGTDTTASPIVTYNISASELAALPAFIHLDITTEVQYALDSQAGMLRMYLPSFDSDPSPGGLNYVMVHNPQAAPSTTHSYLTVNYRYSTAFYQSQSSTGRPIDLTKHLNPSSPSVEDRLYLGTPDQGTTSDQKKFYVKNTRTGQRKRVVVVQGLSDYSPIDNSGSVSGNTLQYLDTYNDNGSDELTAEGTLRIQAISGTTFSVYHTLPGGSESAALEEDGTAATVVSMAADRTFIYAGNKHVKIPTTAWSATTGFNASDVYRTTLKASSVPASYNVATLGLTYIANDNSDSMDTSKKKRCDYARADQFWDDPHNVDIGGTIHTHLKMRDTGKFNTTANPYIDLLKADGTTVERVAVETVYSRTHGTYPNEIRLNTTITLGDYSPSSIGCTGLLAGTLEASVETRLNGAHAAGAETLNLDAALSPAPSAGDDITVIDLTTGDNEVVEFEGQTGTNLTIVGSIENTYTDGALVVYNETISSEPFWMHAVTADTTPEGLYLSFMRTFEYKVV